MRDVTLFGLILLLMSVSTYQSINVHLTKIECLNLLPSLLEFVNCQLVHSKLGFYEIYFSIKFTEDLSNVSGMLDFIIERNKASINYTSIKLNGCTAFVEANKNIVLKVMSDELTRVSNIPFRCPFKKNITYSANGFRINTKLIPSYAPELSFLLDLMLKANNINMLNIKVNGRLETK